MAKSTNVISGNETNRQIRRIARKRTITNYKKLLFVSAISTAHAFLSYSTMLLFTNMFLITAIKYLIGFIFTPMSIGITLFFYEMYVHGEAKLSRLFYFYTTRKLLITSAVLGLLNLAFSLLNSQISQYIDFLKESTFLFMSLNFFAIIIYSYLVFRLFLRYYIFGLNEDENARTIILKSFRYTKRRFLEVLWFLITVVWWLVFLSILSFVLFSPFVPPEFYLFTFTPIVFFEPYIWLAIAGFAHKLLMSTKK
ncbi:MAG: hypothetical protein FWH04_08320 [Oscillospiraceae bacterium]|nr:hypothetical protein [Oscillospiraceae bacterium]